MSADSDSAREDFSLCSDTSSGEDSRFSPNLLRAVADLVLSTTYDGVWLIDSEARTSFINERVAQMLGYSVDEMLGVPLRRFMDDEGRILTERNLARRMDGIQEQHEIQCVRKDGALIWMLVTANPVYDRQGRYAGSLALIADLSVQKAREQALVREKLELERRLNELTASRLSLEALVHQDPLTGLHNRRYLEQRLLEEAARAKRYQRSFCVLYLDIDQFKRINDRHGHGAGDAVLKRVARALSLAGESDDSAHIRASDVVARYGGDEFVIVALETDLAGGHAVA